MSVHVLKNGNLDAGSTAPHAASNNAPLTPRKGAALRLVSTKDLERDDWLEVRRTGIGSSDAAAAIGLNPYQSQLELWIQKTGKGDLLPVVDPNDDTSPMFWGTLLVKLPLEMGVLSFVQNVDKELRNGGKASTCGIHAGI